MTARFKYPCTGHYEAGDFPNFLARELGEPRANIQAFARELGNVFGPSRITLVNSGSSANLAAALAIMERLKQSRSLQKPQAIVAGFTFPTTVSSLMAAGFAVKVIDTAPGSFCMDPQQLEEAIGPETALVCPTHFLGFPADMPRIAEIAKRHDLYILQDACETLDLRIGGKPAYEYGDLTTWSFYHPHHLSSFGGGAVLSLNQSWHHLVESLTHWGRSCTCHFSKETCLAPPGRNHNFWYERNGHNLELSELNACFGRYQLATWKEQEARRKEHYDILYRALKDFPPVRVYEQNPDSGSPFVFPITLKEELALALPQIELALAQSGVEIRTLMGGVITSQPAYRNLAHTNLSQSIKMSDSSFCLGIHQTLEKDAVSDVAAVLQEVLKHAHDYLKSG